MGGMMTVGARRISGPLVDGWTKKQVQAGGKRAVCKVGRMLRRKRPPRWRRVAATRQGRIRALLLLGPLLLMRRARRAEEQEEDVPVLEGIVVEARPVPGAAAAAVALRVEGAKVGEVVGEKAAAAAGEAGCR